MQLQSNATRSLTKRASDPYQPIALTCDRYLKIESFCVRDCYDFEHIYRVEMEVVEMPRCHAFDISLTIFWERWSEADPQTHLMISLARTLTRDHFNDSPSSRFCGQLHGIHLYYPPLESSDDY